MNRTTSKFTGCILGLGLLLAAAESAHAATGAWDNTFTPSGWTRGGTVGTHYAEWNFFNDDLPAANIQDTTPEVSLFGGGAYQVAELTGAPFITSGGNIYSPQFPTAFNLTAGNLGGGLSNVYLRVATLGFVDTGLGRSFTNFTLNGIAGTYTELFNAALGPGQGNELEALVSWLGISHSGSLSIAFNASGSSVSFDQLSLDVGPVAPVPLPAAAYLMASGLVGLWTMARRKKHAA
jgi:hypothetical protein